ncbi:MAG TPA: regulator [Planctomycetaceae bacterium]|nr:regulator [Blastopirellula sp.]HAY83054.1 regulator [Planctomycetaceae bacterium]|tara:strand:+ start:397 stop:993 length:597 start_codon:yes stop_codon:yes gene_type:complete
MVESMSTKTVFTTGEAAKICKVSQQTIIRCFDNGTLKGFRVPGSRFRRIPRDQLFAFMKDNGIPTDALESGKRKVLVVDDDEELVELLVDVFDKDGRFDTRVANNGFDAGMMVREFRPDLVVLDVMLPDINGKEVCQRVRQDDSLEAVKIICISGMVEQDKVKDLMDSGADDFMNKPFAVDQLMEKACALLEIESGVS